MVYSNRENNFNRHKRNLLFFQAAQLSLVSMYRKVAIFLPWTFAVKLFLILIFLRLSKIEMDVNCETLHRCIELKNRNQLLQRQQLQLTRKEVRDELIFICSITQTTQTRVESNWISRNESRKEKFPKNTIIMLLLLVR